MLVQHRPESCDTLTAHKGANVNVTKIEFGKEATIIIAVLMVALGGCGVIMGIDISERDAQNREWTRQSMMMQREWDRNSSDLKERMLELQRQYRMTELKLDDWTVVAHRSGLVLPGDYTRGPQGNLDSDSFNTPKRK
jgi:hypothetical protein